WHRLVCGVGTRGAIAAAVIGGRLLVLRPLDALRGVMERLARGDFSARADLDGGVARVSALGDAVNSMASALEGRLNERDTAEQARHEAEERMRFALDAAHVGVWEVNLLTGVAYWCETSEAMHGL